MIQKHIVSKNLQGSLTCNKNSLADLADLIRISPISSRVFLLLAAYADDTNAIITDINTIAKMLGVKEEKVKYALRTLIRNGYIEAKEVKLAHKKDIMGVIHDKKLYYKSHKKIWKVIGEKLVTSYKISGTYNRFYINDYIIKCSNNGQEGNILKHIMGNLFYDSRVLNNELLSEE